MQLVELNKSTYQYGFIDIKSEEKGKIFCFKILTKQKLNSPTLETNFGSLTTQKVIDQLLVRKII